VFNSAIKIVRLPSSSNGLVVITMIMIYIYIFKALVLMLCLFFIKENILFSSFSNHLNKTQTLLCSVEVYFSYSDFVQTLELFLPFQG